MEATPNPVKVHEVCRVAPPPISPDSAVPTSLPLIFFDLFWVKCPPVQRIFFFEASHPTTTFLDSVLPKLKHSLSLTPQHYLVLAGNLTWPPNSYKPIIQYIEGDDAVSLTIAESEADFYHLSSNSFRKVKEIHPFLPLFISSDTQAPLMTLQITLFPNKGFSIGYAAHHAVLDGKTTALFMHSWASICRRGGDSTLTEEETPFYDRTSIKDPDDHEKTYINFLFELNGPNNKSLMIWDMNAPTDTMLGTFQLTRADIENMKRRVKNQWQEKQKREPAIHVSSFTITSAYVWVCLVKAKKISTGKVHLGFSVDCRARLEPPLPSTYFGNCLSGQQINADSNDLIGEDGVATAVKAIGEAIESLKEEAVKEFQVSKLFSIDKDRLFTIGGSPRFELYNTDFGWGRPRKVEMTSIDKSGAFSLSDCRDGNGGLEIGIVLKKHETEAFASLFASGLEAC
ncbi:phenolic glucoside malonyltransferase 2-like [Camellia sinensis]|uniref:phenolic glucoside malonyltransferase 2-like n=1 Tax=Camellia sinensis TaxID=4442 RepID=UPI0010359A02|nr:phenolic glucoside malonyltransferase 2-like [Camellia sinensis]